MIQKLSDRSYYFSRVGRIVSGCPQGPLRELSSHFPWGAEKERVTFQGHDTAIRKRSGGVMEDHRNEQHRTPQGKVRAEATPSLYSL